jgi:hypothetical protein
MIGDACLNWCNSYLVPRLPIHFRQPCNLLFDRASASHSWEAGQVNEMVTWLDHHPLPVIAATNHAHRLDTAALGRFVLKLELLPLGPSRAAAAFERFFGIPALAGRADLDKLTPGDFYSGSAPASSRAFCRR